MKCLKHIYRFIPLLVLLGLVQGCQTGKTAQTWFDVTWAGLAGADAFEIQGEAEIIEPDLQKQNHRLNYTASLSNHTRLSVKAEAASNIRAAGLTSGASAAEITTLQLQDGNKWTVMQKGGKDGVGNSWTSAAAGRMNPLAALEELRKMKKNVREERGAARGTRVLRIEPDSEQELMRLKSGLELEIDQLDAKWQSKAKGSPALLRGNKLLGAERQELERMLSGARVRTVYHLTVNKKNNLPQRLMSETELVYQSTQGEWMHESLWNDAKFYNYH